MSVAPPLHSKHFEIEHRARVYGALNDAAMQSMASLARTAINTLQAQLLNDHNLETTMKMRGEAKAYLTVLKWINEPAIPPTNAS